MKRCTIEGCEGTLSERSVLTHCHNCRAGQRYWDGKRPAEILERRRKLTLYHARLDDLIPAQVREIKRRKRA